jgi:type II secretory pathway pseudopilin PulG
MTAEVLFDNWEIIGAVILAAMALLFVDSKKQAKKAQSVADRAEEALREQQERRTGARDEKVSEIGERLEDEKNLPSDARLGLLLARARRYIASRPDRQ